MAQNYDLGNVIGPAGAQGQEGEKGVSIANVTIDSNGHLILTLSNGTTVDAGIAKGGKGNPTIVNGKTGESITLVAEDIGTAPIAGVEGDNVQEALADLSAQTLKYAAIESGTWTPTLRGNTTKGEFIYTSRHGKYCLVGNLVSISCEIAISQVIEQPLGEPLVTGMPFPPATDMSNGIVPGYMRGGKGQSVRQVVAGNIYTDGHINLRCHEIINDTVQLYATNFHATDIGPAQICLPVGVSDCLIMFSATYQI